MSHYTRMTNIPKSYHYERKPDPTPQQRNAICQCGSGKKFKKCCFTPRAWPESKGITLQEWKENEEAFKKAEREAMKMHSASAPNLRMSAAVAMLCAAMIGGRR